jgi:hypothetical protein
MFIDLLAQGSVLNGGHCWTLLSNTDEITHRLLGTAEF